MFEDEEKKRILAAIDAKIEGKQVVAVDHPEDSRGAEVLDLTEMLMASLKKTTASPPRKTPKSGSAVVTPIAGVGPAKGPKRAPKASEPVAAPRARMKK